MVCRRSAGSGAARWRGLGPMLAARSAGSQQGSRAAGRLARDRQRSASKQNRAPQTGEAWVTDR